MNTNKITLLLLFFYVGITFSQDKKTFFHTELDIIIPKSGGVKYSTLHNYDPKEPIIPIQTEFKINEKVLVGANFSYNYELFRNFSIGAVTGISYLSNPSITSLKLGGIIRYTFIHDFQANAFLQVTADVPLTSLTKAGLGEGRVGFNMPIAKFEDFNLTLGAYVMYQSYKLDKPLFFNESPDLLEYRGTGLSLGVRF